VDVFLRWVRLDVGDILMSNVTEVSLDLKITLYFSDLEKIYQGFEIFKSSLNQFQWRSLVGEGLWRDFFMKLLLLYLSFHCELLQATYIFGLLDIFIYFHTDSCRCPLHIDLLKK